ncbi:MAG: hypothetical protein AAB574_03560 [Patescibacteria group bacterium]
MLKNKSLFLSLGGLVSGLGLIYLMATVVVPRVLVTLTKAAPS